MLRAHAADLYRESDVYPNYEGRSGASAREIKTALFNAAQNPDARCLTPLAVLEELAALCRDKSVYEFLQQEVVDGYHDHEEFVRVVEAEYLDAIDEEIRDSMGLVSEAQYRELFERYVHARLALGEGREAAQPASPASTSAPDEHRMAELEKIVMPPGEDRRDFRRGLISAIGAFRLDHPDDAAIDYARSSRTCSGACATTTSRSASASSAAAARTCCATSPTSAAPSTRRRSAAGRGDAPATCASGTATARRARRTRCCSCSAAATTTSGSRPLPRPAAGSRAGSGRAGNTASAPPVPSDVPTTRLALEPRRGRARRRPPRRRRARSSGRFLLAARRTRARRPSRRSSPRPSASSSPPPARWCAARPGSRSRGRAGRTYVLTNAHVVEALARLEAARSSCASCRAAATPAAVGKVIARGRMPDVDLAVIEVAGELPVTPLAPDDALELGDDLVVIGAPFGKGLSVAAGIVSQVEYEHAENAAAPSAPTAMKTDAAIGYGSSGGGVFDVGGRRA